MQNQAKFERFVVGVDGGNASSHALERALDLTSKPAESLRLVHAAHVPTSPWWSLEAAEVKTLETSVLAQARETVLEGLRRSLGSTAEKVPLEETLRVRGGHPGDVLLDEAKQFKAHMIVLGGRTDRRLLDMGSTARAILAQAATPVWVQEGAALPVKRIVAPIDYSEPSRGSLDVAVRLSAQLDVPVTAVHVYSPPNFAYAGPPDAVPGPTYVVESERAKARERLGQWVEERAGSAPLDGKFLEGEVVSTILGMLGAGDVIVMGTNGRSGLARFLLGSIAWGVLRNTTGPVVVVPPA